MSFQWNTRFLNSHCLPYMGKMFISPGRLRRHAVSEYKVTKKSHSKYFWRLQMLKKINLSNFTGVVSLHWGFWFYLHSYHKKSSKISQTSKTQHKNCVQKNVNGNTTPVILNEKPGVNNKFLIQRRWLIFEVKYRTHPPPPPNLFVRKGVPFKVCMLAQSSD